MDRPEAAHGRTEAPDAPAVVVEAHLRIVEGVGACMRNQRQRQERSSRAHIIRDEERHLEAAHRDADGDAAVLTSRGLSARDAEDGDEDDEREQPDDA